MNWHIANRADKQALAIADRHYNRQKPGTPQFVPPGRCLVLVCGGALWVTSWPFAEYVKHDWAGAWINSCFRREYGPLASELIRQAVAATRWYFGDPPEKGIVSFVDASKVRHKRDPDRCYKKSWVPRGRKNQGWFNCVATIPMRHARRGAAHRYYSITAGDRQQMSRRATLYARSKPRTSSACSNRNCNQCFKKNCTCECHKRK